MQYNLGNKQNQVKYVTVNKKDSLGFFILGVYYLLSTVMPIIAQVVSAYIYMSAVLLLYLLIFFRNNEIISFIMPFLGLSILNAFNIIINGSGNFPLFMYQQLLLFIPAVLCFYLFCNNKRSMLRYFIIITIFAFVITAVTSYVGLLTDPSAARIIATIADSKGSYFINLNMKNIGGYNTVYCIVLMFPMIICIYKEKVINRVVMAAIVVIFILFLISAQYTTALLLFSISFALLFMSKNFNGKSVKWFIVIGVISVLFLKPVMGYLFGGLADITVSQTLSDRFKVISDSFYGIKSTIDAASRFDLYARSIDIFTKHPIFGNWVFGDSSIGGHSFILDILGQYGLIGGAALFLMYCQIYLKFYLPFRNTNYYGYLLYTFFQTILLSTINTGEFFLVIVFIAPAIAYLLQEKKYKSVKRGAMLCEDNVGN